MQTQSIYSQIEQVLTEESITIAHYKEALNFELEKLRVGVFLKAKLMPRDLLLTKGRKVSSVQCTLTSRKTEKKQIILRL